MNHWLVRFGYDGRAFAGWARQPGLSTVEGTILGSLTADGRTERARPPVLRVASRTDRGVSARANALALESALPARLLLRRLNGIDPNLFFTALRPIPAGFQPRRAVGRTYRYYHHGGTDRIGRWRRAAHALQGPLDARSFGRGFPADVPAPRRVDTIEPSVIAGGILLEVRAPFFVWGMVRKIVGALREHAADRLTLGQLREAAEGRSRLSLPMAEPEGLVLWDVDYGVPWVESWAGLNRRQRRRLSDRRAALWTAGEIATALES